MTIRIGLVAGPGCGKSTTAADVFVQCKRNGVTVELVQECAREEINKGWQLKHIAEQVILARKQREREDIIPSEISVMVTDSPVFLTYYYALWNCNNVCDEVFVLSELYADFIKDINRYDKIIFLNRVKPYIKDGTRSQSEDESNTITIHLKALLDMHKVCYIEMNGDESAVSEIMKYMPVDINCSNYISTIGGRI